MLDIIQNCFVRDIQEDNRYIFVSDSQDVNEIKEYLGNLPEIMDFNSFFVLIIDGEYIAIKGMLGIIPYLNNSLFTILGYK